MEWLLPSEVHPSFALREAVGGHALVADILARRGYSEPAEALAFLDPDQYSPAPASDLPDLEIAAARLVDAINNEERILVWGDFDVDGQTSTALLLDALFHLGGKVEYHVPHRLKAGHGIQMPDLMEYIRGGVQVVLTCDTGVAEHEAAEAAHVNGVDLLITDHHSLPPSLPDAPAVVNPQRLPEGHPLRDLPGVGVAYMLAQELYALAGRSEEARQFLDLAALGIVSDVATQRLDTRYLLQRGIESLRVPKRTGLRALLQAAQVDPSTMSSDIIGFQVGPRLNALGRLDDARLAVELLTTHNELHAQQIAAQLEVLNNKRKQVEDQIYGAAQDQIASDPSLLNFEALVLVGMNWHAGVIGIVASRLVEQYQRPVVMLTTTPEGTVARGSARSVPGVNIGACIAAVGHLLIAHGGHPGAAGLALDADLIPQLRRQLSTQVRETRDPSVIEGLAVDAIVPLAQMTESLADELNRLAPFGNGNPPIALMAQNLRIVSDAVFGVANKHRRVTVEAEDGTRQMITWWRGAEHPLPTTSVDVLVIPRINDYRGRRSLQLEWVDSRPIPGAVVETGPRWTLTDLRSEADPLAAVNALGLADYRVWAEGMPADTMPFDEASFVTRNSVSPSRALVVWTVPPGPQELVQMLELTGAREVIVVAKDALAESLDGFLKRLGGLVKYALRVYDGDVAVVQLAAATGQREITVRRGLDWLAARGEISVDWPTSGERAQISQNGSQAADVETLTALEDHLRALLAETAAYRAYFRRANLDAFFASQ